MGDELHYDIKTNPGDYVRVYLRGNAANVLVMDDVNYQYYRAGMVYNYYGGYYKKTPVTIRPGVYGNLNVVINLGGFPGSVNAIVQIVHPRVRHRR